jgi:hypothetical protein
MGRTFLAEVSALATYMLLIEHFFTTVVEDDVLVE